MSQDDILSLLKKAKEPLTVSSLSEKSGISQKTIWINLSKLIKKNLVSKEKKRVKTIYYKYYIDKECALKETMKDMVFYSVKKTGRGKTINPLPETN